MKIGVVSRGGIPDDPDVLSPKEGAGVKLHYTMIALASIGNEVFYVCGDNEKYYEVKNGKFIPKRFPWLFQKLLNRLELFKYLITKLGVPWEFCVLYHPVLNFNMWIRTLYVTLREDLDVLQAEFPGYGFPALFSKLFTEAKVSVVEHNVEYFQVNQIAENLSERGRKFIKFVEKFVGTFSNYVIAVSEEDKKRLEKMGIKTSKVIPYGVDIERFQDGDGKRVRKELGIKGDENVLIFHGVLHYEPNRKAVETILERILPELRKTGEKFKILLVGGSPPEIDGEEVITTGYVERLEEYIKAADVAIVPLQAGGGIRLKILEYLASGVPIVSTEKGVEGIGVEDGEEVIISDIDGFPKEIKKLLKNESLREKLKEKGHNFIQNHTWKEIGKMYEELYKEG